MYNKKENEKKKKKHVLEIYYIMYESESESVHFLLDLFSFQHSIPVTTSETNSQK